MILSMRFLLITGILISIDVLSINGSPEKITTYDQRQTGDVNVRISIKDLKIIALIGGGLEDYDYNYDYSELTVKPINLNGTTDTTTTKKPTLISNEDSLHNTTETVVEITPPSPSLQVKPNFTLFEKPIVAALNKPSQVLVAPHGIVSHKQNASNSNDRLNETETVNNKIEEPVLKPIPSRPISSSIPVQVVVTPVEFITSSDRNRTQNTLESTTSIIPKRVRQADCIAGYRKDKKGICRPIVRRPTPPTLLKQLIQLSRRVQAGKTQNA